MSDPNLDIVLPTNNITTYQECSTAEDTLSIIEWEPDGRTIEEGGFDNVPFSITINT